MGLKFMIVTEPVIAAIVNYLRFLVRQVKRGNRLPS